MMGLSPLQRETFTPETARCRKQSGPSVHRDAKFSNFGEEKSNESVRSFDCTVPDHNAEFRVVPWAAQPIQPISCQQVSCLPQERW
jgi:hypothetical protein